MPQQDHQQRSADYFLFHHKHHRFVFMKGPTSKFYVEEWYITVEEKFEKRQDMDCTELPWHNIIINFYNTFSQRKIPLVRMVPAEFKYY